MFQKARNKAFLTQNIPVYNLETFSLELIINYPLAENVKEVHNLNRNYKLKERGDPDGKD